MCKHTYNNAFFRFINPSIDKLKYYLPVYIIITHYCHELYNEIYACVISLLYQFMLFT